MARLSPSMTFAMNQKSNDLKAKGIDIVNMTLGEPDFNTPEHVKAAARTALEENYTHYTPVGGSLSLREAISDKLQKENGLAYAPADILVSNGAKQSLCNVVMALIDEGDEVIIPAPYWVSYPQMVLLAGGTPVYVETGIEQGFKMTPEQLEKAITPRTRMLILCSPSNPTGAVYSKEELKALADVILRHEDVLVVSDEIYEHLNYVGAHASIASFEGMRERTASWQPRNGSFPLAACCRDNIPAALVPSARRRRKRHGAALRHVSRKCVRPLSAEGICLWVCCVKSRDWK